MTAPAVFLAAFLAAALEAVEALTLLVAVALAAGWRPVLWGAGAALAALVAAGLGLRGAVAMVPEAALHLGVGLLLVLVAASWLAKAAERMGGRRPARDQAARFARARAGLGGTLVDDPAAAWVAGLAAFKAVLLEGLEVMVVVAALGGGAAPGAAFLGALGGCAVVFAAGAALRRPLARLPETAVLFWTAVLLMAFGVRWVGAGLGLSWPAEEVVVAWLAVLFAAAGGLLARSLRARPIARSVSLPAAPHASAPLPPARGVPLARAVAGKLLRLVWADRRLTAGVLAVTAAGAVAVRLVPAARDDALPVLLALAYVGALVWAVRENGED